MGIVSGVGSLLSAPAKVLNDWASQPLKAFEANRSLKDQDKAVEQKIKKETSLSEWRGYRRFGKQNQRKNQNE